MAFFPLSNRARFWCLFISAVVLLQLPIISIPFKWLETYFHELSHGLAALITGGKIYSIELYPNGGGLCKTIGGNHLVISFMGYVGAALWGGLIYLLALRRDKFAYYLSLTLVMILLLTLVLWIRDLLTAVIVLSLLVLFYLKTKLSLTSLRLLYQFTGILVCLNAVLSPLYLIDGRQLGDGATLAKLTFIPEFIWVIIWSSIGIWVLYKLGREK